MEVGGIGEWVWEVRRSLLTTIGMYASSRRSWRGCLGFYPFFLVEDYITSSDETN